MNLNPSSPFRRFVLPILGMVLVIGSIGIFVFASRQSTEDRSQAAKKKPTPTPLPQPICESVDVGMACVLKGGKFKVIVKGVQNASSVRVRAWNTKKKARNYSASLPLNLTPQWEAIIPQANHKSGNINVQAYLINKSYKKGVLCDQKVVELTATCTPVVIPDTVEVPIRVRFQGITKQTDETDMHVTLKTASTTTTIWEQDVVVTSDASGVFSGTLSGVKPGTYDVYIKGWAHLQKKFPSMTVLTTPATMDFTATVMKAGDIVCGSPCENEDLRDNVINVLDLGKILSDYTPDTPEGSLADLNLDGVVNTVDLGMVLGSYNEEGDK